jgi:hypothetical protein
MIDLTRGETGALLATETANCTGDGADKPGVGAVGWLPRIWQDHSADSRVLCSRVRVGCVVISWGNVSSKPNLTVLPFSPEV